MKQISLATNGFELATKRARKRVFLDEMSLVVPWSELVGLIKGLAKNMAQLMTLFALSNVWMARRHLLGAWG